MDDTTDLPGARVKFRIFAPGLEPETITQKLGLNPSHTHRQGDYPRGNPKYTAYKHGMWALDSPLALNESFEAHLDALLALLEPQHAYICTLAESATVDFYCTLFWQNGFQLPPQILSRIADLRAAFGVVVYPADSDLPE